MDFHYSWCASSRPDLECELTTYGRSPRPWFLPRDILIVPAIRPLLAHSFLLTSLGIRHTSSTNSNATTPSSSRQCLPALIFNQFEMSQLVIAGRTRYPSDCSDHGDPPTIDRQIAKTLLNLDGHSHSRHVSTQSSAHSNTSFQRDTTSFVEKYNELAQRHGLNALNLQPDYCFDERNASLKTPKPTTVTKRGIWRKLVRSTSSHHLPEARHLVRKNSLNTLLGKQPKLALNCQSLDDFYQYGGTSILNLPAPYRAFHLSIPTCIAASGNYLLQHGQNSGGIFRIPGQNSIVQALYHYYVAQMHEAQNADELVHESVGSMALPVDISCSVQDVASVFKKFLWDLPGGILGSTGLFQALYSLQIKQDCVNLKPRLCALAILSLESNRRIAIISAVLGMLAFLKQDSDGTKGSPNTPSRVLTSESMSSKAVSLVFAPILLGNLIDQINVSGPRQPEVVPVQHTILDTPRRGFKNAFRTPKHRKSTSIDHMPEMQASVERNNMAVDILEMLLRNWEDIATHMRMLDSRSALERSAKSFNNLVGSLPPLRQGSIFDGQDSSATSTGSVQGHLQVPLLSHSISLRNISYHESSSSSDDQLKMADHANQDIKQDLSSKLASYDTKIDRHGIEAAVKPSENVPWWSRKLSHSFRSSTKSSGTDQNALRMASGSTMPSQTYSGSHDQEISSNSSPLTSTPNVFSTLADSMTQKDGIEMGGIAKAQTNAPSADMTIDKIDCRELTPRKPSDNSSQGPIDSGIDTSCRASEESVSEAGSLEDSMPAHLLAGSSSLRINRSFRKTSARDIGFEPDREDVAAASRQKDIFRDPRVLPVERLRSGGHTAERCDTDIMQKPLRVSPSLIPRPVCHPGRQQNSGTGSPGSRVSASAERRPLSRLPRTSTVRARGSNISTTERLHPMYPRPFLGKEELRECVVRSEPIPRSVDHASSQANGLREEPVARQLDFERPLDRSKAYRMIDNKMPLARQQVQGHRGSANVGTLYAEIRILNDKLTGARRECAEWRNRAQWAESVLFGRSKQGQQQESYQY